MDIIVRENQRLGVLQRLISQRRLYKHFFFVGVIYIVPLHFLTLVTALITMTIWAVFTHLGFEIFPPSSQTNWIGKWLIGSMHHSIHHRKYKVHYGLYFTFWDKLLGTQDPDYVNKNHRY